MVDPYFDRDGNRTDNRGMDFIDPAVLAEAVPRLDALGFQAHFHALGDRAVRHRARRDRGRPQRERLDRHAARISPTSSWSTPTTCRGSGGSGRWPTPSRCGPSTRARWTT